MSWFGASDVSTGGGDSNQFKAAKLEVEMFQDLYTKMSETCFEKCCGKINEAELSVGEMSCIDRCTGKYVEAQEKVKMVLEKSTQAMQAQQQSAQSMLGQGPSATGPSPR